MFSVNTKLEINKQFNGIAEVTGIYPRGQSNYTEDHLQIMINGYRINVPAALMGTMFKTLAPNAIIEEEIIPEVIPEIVTKEPEKKVIKKLTKKN